MAGENRRQTEEDGIPAGFAELLEVAGRMPPIVPDREAEDGSNRALSREEIEAVDFGIGCGEKGNRLVKEVLSGGEDSIGVKPTAELFIESIDLNDSQNEESAPPNEAIIAGVRGKF